jgi:predicted nucleic acid-binding protein
MTLTFFVDANVVIYSAVPSQYREPCLEILDAISRGAAEGKTSTAVLEEVWFVERSGRAGNVDGLTARAYTLFTPLLAVTDEAFQLALSVDGTSALGTNDRVHVGTCWAHGVASIVSADAGFDRVRDLRRVDPLDLRGKLKLITSAGR